MITTDEGTPTRKRVVGGGMKSNRYKVRKAYAGLKSKAAAQRGRPKAKPSRGEAKKAPRAKTYKGKSLRPGGGGQFAKGVDEMMAGGKSREVAGAIMAKQGRAKYGQAQMTQWATAGRKRAKAKKGK